jgi:DNA-binding NtrC family response regulator
VLLSSNSVLDVEDLHFDAPGNVAARQGAGSTVSDEALTLPELERRHIERVLRAAGGRVAEAAERLGIPRSSLYHKIKALQIPLSKS